MSVKRVHKFGTGRPIPEGAVYLSTVTQTEVETTAGWLKCWLVWHYFLVETET